MLGKRVAAAIIDIVILGVVWVVLALAIGDTESSDGRFSLSLNGFPALLFFAISIGYYILMEFYLGATVGKKALGLRVAADAGDLTLMAVVLRNVFRIVDGLPFFYLLGFIVAAARSDGKRIGDIVANTNVVAAEAAVADPSITD